MPRSPARETFALLGVAAVWVLLERGLFPACDSLFPAPWKAKFELRTFLVGCQVVTAGAGVGLSVLVLERPREALAARRPRLYELATAALLAPGMFVASSVIALRVALPSLLDDLARRGPGASRQDAGAFGKALEQGPLLATLIWGALLAALTEELLFRGALWSAVENLTALIAARAERPVPGAEERPDFMTPGFRTRVSRAVVGWGVVPAVVTAAVFGSMHGDLQGGVGVMRVAASTCLALACGAGRQLTGSLWTPVLLHLLNNATAIAQGRGWFSGGGAPWIEGLPNPLLEFAAVSAAGWAALALSRRVAARDGS